VCTGARRRFRLWRAARRLAHMAAGRAVI
jgi:hypothetical protein